MIKVIIIDDDDDNALSVKYLLKLKGIDVIAVGKNGKEAVELYEKHQPDVVLLDLLMPEYDGYYAIEAIGKLDHNAKIIIISGNLEHKTRKILEYGIVHSIITKPYNSDDLIKKILN